MKKYFILAAAAITLVACNQKEMENDGVQEPKVINLTATINSGEDVTRASSDDALATALQNTQFVSGKKIFVEVYETGNNTQPYTSGKYTADGEGGLTCDVVGGLFYPANNGAVDIRAYYPDEINRNSGTFFVQEDQSSEAAYQLSDLMYATKLTEVPAVHNAEHALTFNHALTKVVVNITLGAGMTTALANALPTVTSVKINGTKTNATLSIANTGVITPTATGNSPTDIEIKGTANSVTGLKNTGIIIPQTVAAETTFITVHYNNADYTYRLPQGDDTTFAAGKVYTYNLTLTARGLVLNATTITNWTAEAPVPQGITI